MASPRLQIAPPGDDLDYSLGDRVVAISDRLGLTLDDWQADVVRLALARRDGRWAASRVGLSIPRQQGKTAILEAIEAGLLLHDRRIVASAHHFRTSAAHARRLTGLTDHDAFLRRGRKAYTSNGREAVEMRGGGRLDFLARSKGSGRGLSGDVLVFDEAQELTSETFAAMAPLVSASPDPLMIFTGTPVTDSALGEVFAALRQDAIDGTDDRLVYVEYAADESDDPAAFETWAKANPALGVRLAPDHVATEHRAMSPDTFAVERLGIWPALAGGGVFDPVQWEALFTDAPFREAGRLYVGLDVTRDRFAALVACKRLRGGADAPLALEVIRAGHGTHWIVPELRRLLEAQSNTKVVADTLLVDTLFPRGTIPAGKLLPLSFTDVKSAAATLVDAVAAGTVRHHGSPELTASIVAARMKSGDAVQLQRTEDSAPVIAASHALWAATQRASADAEPRRGLVL